MISTEGAERRRWIQGSWKSGWEGGTSARSGSGWRSGEGGIVVVVYGVYPWLVVTGVWRSGVSQAYVFLIKKAAMWLYS